MSPGPLTAAALDTRTLGAVLRSIEVAMRAEGVAEITTERVLNLLVYGDRNGPRPDPDEQVYLPPPTAEGKLIDLMQALEDSVREAKASRARKLAADAGGEG